jgi:hypothetical protein
MTWLAHGVATRHDLPLPWSHVLGAAAAAVLISFAVCVLARRVPRPSREVALPAWVTAAVDSVAFRRLARGLGLLGATWVLVGLVAGAAPSSFVPGAVYVVLWVGIPVLSLLFGPVWRVVSPFRTLHALLVREPERGLRDYPARLGCWPAAGLLFCFVWVELVAPEPADMTVLRVLCLAYAVLVLGGAVLFGDRWFAAADGFEVFSALAARLAFVAKGAGGRLVLRNPVGALGATPLPPGTSVVVVVLLGATLYDALSGTTAWHAVDGDPLAGTLGLVGVTGLLLAAYLLTTRLTPRPGPAFAAAVIPVAVGYQIAHYYSMLVVEGQRTLFLAADPLGTGADLFGLGGQEVSFAWVTPPVVAAVQALAVVSGHVVGVVTTHENAIRVRRGPLGELPMLVLTVAITLAGLALLFSA